MEYYQRANMQGSNALDIYDVKKAEKSLKMLLNDKSNEFRELAQALDTLPQTRAGN